MSEVKVKPFGKILILLILAGVGIGAYRLMTGKSPLSAIIPEAPTRESQVPVKADLPTINNTPTPETIKDLSMPSNNRFDSTKPRVRWLHWAWNAHLGLFFANGGKSTTNGSLMADRDIAIDFTRQDDVNKMQEALVDFATELSRGNKQPSRGTHFVTIMGDGAAAFLAGLNGTLGKLGPEYTAKIVGAIGFSRGEDKFMGPKSWADSPSASKGGVVAGYLRDGDWNIAMKWLGDNGLKNNPDEKTYDPDAMNWVAANDYIDAAEKYISGYTETRPVVRNGKRTGETKTIKVDAVVTWTPGDVNVADKKGGLVSIVSTKEYNAQMPCVVIGIDKWMRENEATVADILDAALIGGDAVRSSSAALRRAAEIGAEAFGEQDASYWERYYKGTIEKDKTGMMVELGGSSVNNIADNMFLFGQVSGSANIFQSVYRIFGDIVKDQYPDLMPSYPAYDSITDMRYIKAVAKKQNFSERAVATSDMTPTPTKPTSGSSKPPAGRQISSKAWKIEFETGRATFKPQSKAVLEKLISELSISTTTSVEIHGHTDNVGDSSANMKLSEARAFAVQNYLNKRAPRLFPQGRVSVIAHGQTRPLVPNSSNENRARNRRVEIKVPGKRMSSTTPVSTPPANRKLAGLKHAFSPNKILSRASVQIIIAVQILAFLVIWSTSSFKVLPKPGEVFKAIGDLWQNQGLGQELISSITLNLEAIAISSVLSIGLAYLTVMPFFRPLVNAIAKGRFLSMAGFTLIFTLLVGGGHPLKLSLLVFAMTVFFVTSMASVVAEIPKADFDYARTLRMSEWRVVWEVVVLGTADKALEVLRQNAAIGWMMLTMVEGIYRGEGGIGAMLLNQQKFFKMSEVFGIQIVILLVGLFQDVFLGMLRRFLCPYSALTLERKG